MLLIFKPRVISSVCYFNPLLSSDAATVGVAWWMYLLILVFILCLVLSITCCCCGCFGKLQLCQDDEGKEITPTEVVMSQLGNNPYNVFDDGAANSGGHDVDDYDLSDAAEDGVEVVQYEWGKDDSHIPAPYSV